MTSPSIRALIFDFGGVIGHFDHGRTARKLAPFSSMSEAKIRAYLYPDELEDAYEHGHVSSDHLVQVLRDQGPEAA